MINSHKDLAKAIQGKKILHLNSLGKDAILCLEWLNNFADCQVTSCFLKFGHGYPTDDMYWDYLKKRYPKTKFVTEISIAELSEKADGTFQSPLVNSYVTNNLDYDEFDRNKYFEELRALYGCDYICSGMSCYEGMGRAIYIRRVGLLDQGRKMIYPIGLMKQAQVIELLKNTKVKLNPSYKFSSESHDNATYYKMRTAFLARPDFKRIMYQHFPMLMLDQYRYEVLFNGKIKRKESKKS